MPRRPARHMFAGRAATFDIAHPRSEEPSMMHSHGTLMRRIWMRMLLLRRLLTILNAMMKSGQHWQAPMAFGS